jgi:hypothetical protein
MAGRIGALRHRLVLTPEVEIERVSEGLALCVDLVVTVVFTHGGYLERTFASQIRPAASYFAAAIRKGWYTCG